jgi:hypothetical protein
MSATVETGRSLTLYEQIEFARKHYPNMPSDILCGTLCEMHPEIACSEIVMLIARVKNNQIH